MSARLVPVLLFFLVVPAMAQQQTISTRGLPQPWASREIRPEPVREVDVRAARLRSIHDDAQALSGLNAELQTELQQLQKGMLPRDLAAHLKKIEKLSKKLRQEVER